MYNQNYPGFVFDSLEKDPNRENKYRVTDVAWESIVRDIDMTKTPGLPYAKTANQNDALFQNIDELRDVFNHRLNVLMYMGYLMRKQMGDGSNNHIYGTHLMDGQIANEAINLVQCGARDPVLLNYKGEARKKGKLPRLVCAVSVVDNMVWRLLFGHFLKNEQKVEDVGAIATAVHLDLSTHDVMQGFYDWVVSKSSEHFFTTSDIKGWEYTCRPEAMWFYTLYVLEAQGMSFWRDRPVNGYRINAVDKNYFRYMCLVTAWTRANITRLYATEEGTLFTLRVPGVIDSGSYVTFSRSSLIRAHLSFRISEALVCKTAGDDNLELTRLTPEQLIEAYKKAGYILTDVHVHNGGSFSFCSTHHSDGRFYQENIMRSLYQFLIKDHSFDSYTSFVTCFRQHPLFERALYLISRALEPDELNQLGWSVTNAAEAAKAASPHDGNLFTNLRQ